MIIEEVFLHPTRQLVGSVSIRSGDSLRDWTGDRETERDRLRDTVSNGVFSPRLRLQRFFDSTTDILIACGFIPWIEGAPRTVVFSIDVLRYESENSKYQT